MIPVRLVQILDERLSTVTCGHQILTTLEGENPGGSIKDRIVLGELEELLGASQLQAGDWVAEISAGSTAHSLAFYCQQLGLKCCLFVPTSLSDLAKNKLQDLGAELHLVEPEGAYAKYDEFTQSKNIFRFDQFHNLSLRRHYHSMMKKIERDLTVDALVGAVGTGHSLLGLAQALRKKNLVYSAEPTQAQNISGIRNLRLESFGDQDPCEASSFSRTEVEEQNYFPDKSVRTDCGMIEISESFRVVLGALEKTFQDKKPQTIFAVGAKNLMVA